MLGDGCGVKHLAIRIRTRPLSCFPQRALSNKKMLADALICIFEAA
jgi:hypothetical protein